MRLKFKDTLADVFASWRQVNQICSQAHYFHQEIDQPLVMVSQVQRSGGSLMAELFDDHPEVFAHPHEIKIGYPNKYTWPPIDINQHPRKNYELLIENQKFLKEGYNKVIIGEHRMRFYLPSVIQMTLFSNLCAENPPLNERDILNAYFSSYFNAWLNFAGWSGQKKYVTGFTPRLMQQPQYREKFWQAYPSGWHIGIVRKPDGWLHSAEKESKTRWLATNAERVLLWKDSARSILESKRENPDQVIVVIFEDLISNTVDVMGKIADKLGIQNDPTLSSPTFNGDPISSNSSFGMAKAGKIDKSVISRQEIVGTSYSSQVDDEAYKIYETAREIAI